MPPPLFKKKKWVVYRGIYNSRVIVLAMTSDGKETKKYVVESYLLGSFWKLKLVTHLRWNRLYYRYFVLWSKSINCLKVLFFFGTWITGSFSSIYSIRFADLDIFEIVACIKRILQKNLLLKFLISFTLHLITLMHITCRLYIIRLKKMEQRCT